MCLAELSLVVLLFFLNDWINLSHNTATYMYDMRMFLSLTHFLFALVVVMHYLFDDQ